MSITWGHGGHSTNIGLNSCTRAGEIYDGGLLQTRSHATSATAAKMAAAPARDWPFSRSPSRAKPKAADHSGWAVGKAVVTSPTHVTIARAVKASAGAAPKLRTKSTRAWRCGATKTMPPSSVSVPKQSRVSSLARASATGGIRGAWCPSLTTCSE
eukprot:scaffold44161_cov78-Phaeocystis_antarctica.AAC.2